MTFLKAGGFHEIRSSVGEKVVGVVEVVFPVDGIEIVFALAKVIGQRAVYQQLADGGLCVLPDRSLS